MLVEAVDSQEDWEQVFGASWNGMQQLLQHNLHVGTTVYIVVAYLKIACFAAYPGRSNLCQHCSFGLIQPDCQTWPDSH